MYTGLFFLDIIYIELQIFNIKFIIETTITLILFERKHNMARGISKRTLATLVFLVTVYFCFIALNIQLRLDGITNCEVYIESGRTTKASGITTRLSQGVEGLCACGFSPSLLTDEFINCFEGSSSHVTYRAVVTGTESVSTIQLSRLMKQWVENDPIVVVQSAGLSVTNSCPIVIANLNSPECPEDITNRTTATTSPTESVVVNVGPLTVAGWVVAGVLAIAVLVLIVIVVLLLLRQQRYGSKDMSDEKTGSQPTQ